MSAATTGTGHAAHAGCIMTSISIGSVSTIGLGRMRDSHLSVLRSCNLAVKAPLIN